MRHRLAGCKKLRGFLELLSVECSIRPTVKDLHDLGSRLETLGSN